MRLSLVAVSGLAVLIFGVRGQSQYRSGSTGASGGIGGESDFSGFQGDSNSFGGSTDSRDEGVGSGGSSAQGEVVEEFGGLEETIPGTPGNDYPILSQVPETSFLCDGQAEGGYYADPEAECQAFHICTGDENGGLTKFSFLCPNGTVFQQQYFVCDWWFNVDCSRSVQFYSLNNEIAAERQSNSPSGSDRSGDYENESRNVGQSAKGGNEGGRDKNSDRNNSRGNGGSARRENGSAVQSNYSGSQGGSSSSNGNSGYQRDSSANGGTSRSNGGSSSTQGYPGSQGGSPGQSANTLYGAPGSGDGNIEGNKGGQYSGSDRNKSLGNGGSGRRGISSSVQGNYSGSRGGSSSSNGNSGSQRGSSANGGTSRSKGASSSSQVYPGSQGGSPGQSANALYGAPGSVNAIDSGYSSPKSRGSSIEDQSSLGLSRGSISQRENKGIVNSYESPQAAGSSRGSSKGSARGSSGPRGSSGYNSSGVSQHGGFTDEGKAGKAKGRSGTSKGRKNSIGNNRGSAENEYSAPKSPRGRGGAQGNGPTQGQSAEDSYGAPHGSVLGVGQEAFGGTGINYGSVGNGDDGDNGGGSESEDSSYRAHGGSIERNNGILGDYEDLQNVYSRSPREF